MMNHIGLDIRSGRMEIPSDYDYIAVSGEKNARKLYFSMPKFPTELVNLYDMDISVNYITPAGEQGVSPVTEKTDNGQGSVTFAWVLTEEICKTAGTLKFSLCAKSDAVHWHTETAEREILTSIIAVTS